MPTTLIFPRRRRIPNLQAIGHPCIVRFSCLLPSGVVSRSLFSESFSDSRVSSGSRADRSNDVGSLRLRVKDGLETAGGEVDNSRLRCDRLGNPLPEAAPRATLFTPTFSSPIPSMTSIRYANDTRLKAPQDTCLVLSPGPFGNCHCCSMRPTGSPRTEKSTMACATRKPADALL
jgi:hypothetical protein